MPLFVQSHSSIDGTQALLPPTRIALLMLPRTDSSGARTVSPTTSVCSSSMTASVNGTRSVDLLGIQLMIEYLTEMPRSDLPQPLDRVPLLDFDVRNGCW